MKVVSKISLRKELTKYLASNSIRHLSYMEAYNHFVKEKRIAPSSDYINKELVTVFGILTSFMPSSLDQSTYAIPLLTSRKTLSQYIHDSLNEVHRVNDAVFDTYDNELRLQKSEKDSKLSFWIAIGAFCISGIQLVFQVYDSYVGKDYKHETILINLDSQQVEQNKRIIELLEKRNSKKDTIIVNVTVPETKK